MIPVQNRTRFLPRLKSPCCSATTGSLFVREAQLQSGLIFGLTAVIYGEITLKGGRVEQANFDKLARRVIVPTVANANLCGNGQAPAQGAD